jgi:ATP-dependent Clp protease ATP-binding subunit ClpA
MTDLPEFSSFGRYSTEALRVLFRARRELKRLGGEALEPEHLLLTLMQPEGGAAYDALRSLNFPFDAVRQRLEDRLRQPGEVARDDDLPLSPRLKTVLDRAVAGATAYQIGSRDLLASLTIDASGEAAAILREEGVTPAAIA